MSMLVMFEMSRLGGEQRRFEAFGHVEIRRRRSSASRLAALLPAPPALDDLRRRRLRVDAETARVEPQPWSRAAVVEAAAGLEPREAPSRQVEARSR